MTPRTAIGEAAQAAAALKQGAYAIDIRNPGSGDGDVQLEAGKERTEMHFLRNTSAIPGFHAYKDMCLPEAAGALEMMKE